eukprot:TRINITY_DN2056_c0_g3_i1.p1 TRINITY_DN2056_c0_g3~~TRINITY_DN2056_c0_g3_i1.p1  ORF type:complete len:114 (+),score=4.06 TRINITY_DN2056_c0_g3_i1:612-953(+)
MTLPPPISSQICWSTNSKSSSSVFSSAMRSPAIGAIVSWLTSPVDHCSLFNFRPSSFSRYPRACASTVAEGLTRLERSLRPSVRMFQSTKNATRLRTNSSINTSLSAFFLQQQ